MPAIVPSDAGIEHTELLLCQHACARQQTSGGFKSGSRASQFRNRPGSNARHRGKQVANFVTTNADGAVD